MGFDISYKLSRVLRLRHEVGLAAALRFELLLTLRRPTVRLAPYALRHPVHLRLDTSDFSVFHHVLLDRDCDVPLDAPPAFIVDAGANVGISTAFLATKYPGAIVVALEPDPDNYERLRLNTRRYPNVHPLKAGLWHRPAHLTIENPDAPSWARRVVECPESTPGAVHAVTPLSLMDRFNRPRIDLFKIDIEGAEHALFSHDADPWLSKTTAISVEPHHDPAVECITAAARRLGFATSRTGEKLILRPATSPPPPTVHPEGNTAKTRP